MGIPSLEKEDQLNRWEENFEVLFNRPTPLNPQTFSQLTRTFQLTVS